ncbi:MAG: TRAP transporter small permease [Spiribacter sp.]|nr:TRAP transporter small permease [Spiribacter sp.]
MRVLPLVSRLEEVMASLCLAGMVVTISLQVFNRYVMGSSLYWSEELGRYLFIWAVYIGCAYATQHEKHFGVELITRFAPARVSRFTRTVSDLISLAFCLIATWWSIDMLQFLAMTGQKAPALGVSIIWVYLCVPIGFGLTSIRLISRLTRWRRDFSTPLPSESKV